MPEAVQFISWPLPQHIRQAGQAILFRGAGLSVVWPNFAALAVIGAALFAYTLARFRATIGSMA